MDSPNNSSLTTQADTVPTGSGASERSIVLVLLLVILALRFIYIFRYEFDSDEPQHLHIIWAWVNGLLQYRDVFDNHTPLFHMLLAPLLAVIGEREDALLFMRMSMVPLYLGCLWTVYRMGRELYSRQVGSWAAILAGLLPAFFLCTVEFRTDVLWTLLWLISVRFLCIRPPSIGQWAIAGVLLGLALGVSVKSILMYFTLAVAGVGTLLVFGGIGHLLITLRKHSLHLLALIVGVLVTPAGLVLFFRFKGALSAFWYGTLQHNVLPGSTSPWVLLARFTAFGIAFTLLCLAAARLQKSDSIVGKDPRRAFLFLTAGTYLSAVACLWPIHTTQTYLPVIPLILLLATPVMLRIPLPSSLGRLSGPLSPLSRFFFPLAVALLELSLVLVLGAPWKDGTREQILLCREVLSLTNPTDFVMDQKGETIFRRRPFYFALETITQERIRSGQIQDLIPESLTATETCVAARDNEEFPPRGRKFLLDNYLDVGRLRVAGRFLPEPKNGGGTPCVSFDVLIPSRYVLMDENGMVEGLLDGTNNDRARYLTAGAHELCPSGTPGQLAFVWAQAIDRGFSPFAGRNR